MEVAATEVVLGSGPKRIFIAPPAISGRFYGGQRILNERSGFLLAIA